MVHNVEFGLSRKGFINFFIIYGEFQTVMSMTYRLVEEILSHRQRLTKDFINLIRNNRIYDRCTANKAKLSLPTDFMVVCTINRYFRREAVNAGDTQAALNVASNNFYHASPEELLGG